MLIPLVKLDGSFAPPPSNALLITLNCFSLETNKTLVIVLFFQVKQPVFEYLTISRYVCLHPRHSSASPNPHFNPHMMEFLQRMRSPRLSFIQTLVSLFLGGVALMSSYWCVGKQKMPKPLCTPTKHSNCIPVPGVSNSSNIQFFWETGDDRFVFPTFHTGLFLICEENIYADAWGEMGGKWVEI